VDVVGAVLEVIPSEDGFLWGAQAGEKENCGRQSIPASHGGYLSY
jgi:hypothetical protein